MLLVYPIQEDNINPCQPSPCGPNSICRVQNSQAVCSCVSNYIGRPPNCRPECTIDPDCPTTLACVCDKCKDPCIGTCGFNAQCSVLYHRAHCTCHAGFTGDPYSGCSQVILRKNSYRLFLSQSELRALIQSDIIFRKKK